MKTRKLDVLFEPLEKVFLIRLLENCEPEVVKPTALEQALLPEREAMEAAEAACIAATMQSAKSWPKT